MKTIYFCTYCFEGDDILTVVDTFVGEKETLTVCPKCRGESSTDWEYPVKDMIECLEDLKKQAKDEYESQVAELDKHIKEVKKIEESNKT